MVVAPDKRVFFFDGTSGHIYRLNSAGRPEGFFGRKGEGPGEIRMGASLHLTPDQKQLVVFDYGKTALVVFDLNGNPQAPIQLDQSMRGGAIMLSADRMLLLESRRVSGEEKGGEVSIRDLGGGKKTVLASLDVSRHSGPLILTMENQQVHMSMPWIPSALIVFSPQRKRIFVGTTSMFDFKVFDSVSGKPVAWTNETELPRKPLTDEMLDKDMETLGFKRSMISSTVPEWLPVIESVFCDSLGRLWVRLWPADLEQAVYHVYSEEGRRVGKLVLDRAWFIAHADEDDFWGSRTDRESEETYIFKAAYQLSPF